MKPIFQKNLQFGDIWPRNRQEVAQIEVFGHFLNFASLVFLDFAHNGRWAWCVVVFLKFVGPVSVFLFCKDSRSVVSINIKELKRNFAAPFYGWGSTASRLQSHYEEVVYFLPLSSQKYLVLIWLTLEE